MTRQLINITIKHKPQNEQLINAIFEMNKNDRFADVVEHTKKNICTARFFRD